MLHYQGARIMNEARYQHTTERGVGTIDGNAHPFPFPDRSDRVDRIDLSIELTHILKKVG